MRASTVKRQPRKGQTRTAKNQPAVKKAAGLLSAGKFTDAIDVLIPVVKGMQLNKPSSNDIFALLMMADAQRFSGNQVDAYKNYVVASELDPERASELTNPILNCLCELETPIKSPVFESHIIQYLVSPRHDNPTIDQMVCRLLIDKYQLADENAEVDFTRVILDDLFLSAISHLTLPNPYIEKFLSSLRDTVFTLSLENNLPEELQPVVIALAKHAELIEHAMPVSAAESVLLLNIKVSILARLESVADFTAQLGFVCLYGMYESPADLPCAGEIAHSSLSDWAGDVQPLIKNWFVDRVREKELSAEIPSLGEVTDDVSHEVMAQYQQNPYPHWQHLSVPARRISYRDQFDYLSGVELAPTSGNKLKCLVAGCGTGKQPLWISACCDDVAVQALDLSLPSLGYAKRKAVELDLAEGVTFMHGDILNLTAVDEEFDVIECSGVLHHMSDPEAGLKILLEKLKPGGLIRLGLYSRIARDKLGINAARAHDTPPTLENIRALRQSAFDEKSPFHGVTRSRDFYSTSECRDLLFHVQEHQYDLLELENLLERNQLKFLGFQLKSTEILDQFKREHPDSEQDLRGWHEFELKHPYIFKSMYQFHCQKPA